MGKNSELFADLTTESKVKKAEPVEETVNQETEAEVTETKPDELALLKKQADTLGVSYKGNIGIEALKARIQEKLGTGEEEVEVAPVKRKSLVQAMRDKHMRLVRCRISNMNPAKASIPGEILTVANRFIGKVAKFVPYRGYDDGYHLPACLYEAIKDREYLRIVKIKDKVTGREYDKAEMVKEFAIALLPDLTPAELAKLAADQRARGGVSD